MSTEPLSEIVIRAPNWIGDAVMCTPALMDVRECYPEARITLWARPAIAELLQGHPGIDRVLLYHDRERHAGIWGKVQFVRSLRRLRFQVALLFQNAFESAFLAWLAGIPHRWGYATDGRRLWLSKAVLVPREKRRVHQVQYYQSLVQEVLGRSLSRGLHLEVSEDDEKNVDGRFPALVLKDEEYLIGLNPGAVYGSSKRWLPDRFAELADRLIEQIPLKVDGRATVKCVIVGGAGEEVLTRVIASSMRARALILTGQTSIRELMVIIKRCSMFVTNDTGPMHIASALNVPLVAIFGSTDPDHTAPFGRQETVVQQPVACAPCFLRACPIDHRCMTQVSVQQAYETAMLEFQAKIVVG